MGARLSTRARPRTQPTPAKPLPLVPVDIGTSEFDVSAALGPRCTICLEYNMEFPSTPPTPGCTHAIDVCASCLRSYVSSGISNALSLRCPTTDCIGQMDVDEIQACIGESHREEFERQVSLRSLYSMQGRFRQFVDIADSVRERLNIRFEVSGDWYGVVRLDVNLVRFTSEEVGNMAFSGIKLIHGANS